MHPRRSSSRGRHQPAFTIAELIVATVVASTIMLAVYSVMWHASRVEGRASVAWRDYEAAQSLVDEIAAILENVLNPPAGHAIDGHAHQKQGDYSLTCFVGPAYRHGHSALAASCQWRQYSWTVFPGTERPGKMIVLSVPCAGSRIISPQAPQTEDTPDWEHVEAELIATGLREFTVRYRIVGKGESAWQDRYQGPAGQVAIWIRCRIGEEVVERVIVPRAAGNLLTARQ